MNDARRILIVDDSDTAREIYATFLRHAGYDVLEAKDGVAGLDLIRSADPHVVILDVLLPRMDGLEVMRRLRAEDELVDRPVICVTAAMSETYQQEANELGCAAFLEKTNSAREIISIVERVLGEGATAAGNETAG